MPKKDLLSELSEEQLDELLPYTHPFSRENIDSIKNKTFEKIEEKTIMKKPFLKRSFGTIAAVFAAVLVVSTTVFATMHLFRTPSEVIEMTGGNIALTAAFEGETAININQTITSNGRHVTLLAMVSGQDITDHLIYNSTGEVVNDRTYAILAIQNIDGSPMPSPMDADFEPFTVSPFVGGIATWRINAFSMGGGAITIVEDGITYIIADFTNITKFADREVYLGVNSGFGLGAITDAFSFNEATGKIYSNSDFNGTSALFSLPLDSSLGDYDAATQFLYELFGNVAIDLNPIDTNESNPTMVDLMDLPHQRMTYETLTYWAEDQMRLNRASGNYGPESLAMFEQDHVRLFNALRDGYHVYLIDLDNGDFATFITNPNVEHDVSFSIIID